MEIVKLYLICSNVPIFENCKKAISLHPTKDLIRFTTNSPQMQTCLPVKKKKNNLKAIIDNFINLFLHEAFMFVIYRKNIILLPYAPHHHVDAYNGSWGDPGTRMSRQ